MTTLIEKWLEDKRIFSFDSFVSLFEMHGLLWSNTLVRRKHDGKMWEMCYCNVEYNVCTRKHTVVVSCAGEDIPLVIREADKELYDFISYSILPTL